jgi:hypothetical protein
MSRTPIAIVAILVFASAWIAAGAVLGDRLAGTPWFVQALYYVTVGFVWVFPVRWLMLWSVHQR